jgi:hypothetical protein
MTSPARAKLHHLRRLGFGREPILDASGGLAFGYYARGWRGWREVVVVHSEQRAHAYRYRPAAVTDDPLAIDPAAIDSFIPPGNVVRVVNALLASPHRENGHC